MDFRFTPLSQHSLDEIQADLLVVPFFQNERPLRGLGGLVDWRLHGKLSHWLLSGALTGAFAEKTLTPSPTLRAGRLLLVGLGLSESFDAELARQACKLIGQSLEDAGVATVALSLPGRSVPRLNAELALRCWIDAAPQGRLAEMSVIETSEAHRELTALIELLRRQQASPLA